MKAVLSVERIEEILAWAVKPEHIEARPTLTKRLVELIDSHEAQRLALSQALQALAALRRQMKPKAKRDMHHCWSPDGVECLMCARQRTTGEVAAWREAGSPDEVCGAVLLGSKI